MDENSFTWRELTHHIIAARLYQALFTQHDLDTILPRKSMDAELDVSARTEKFTSPFLRGVCCLPVGGNGNAGKDS